MRFGGRSGDPPHTTADPVSNSQNTADKLRIDVDPISVSPLICTQGAVHKTSKKRMHPAVFPKSHTSRPEAKEKTPSNMPEPHGFPLATAHVLSS